MTHSFDEICKLDSERTQGTISVKETSDKRLSLLVINNGSFPDKVSTQLFINDASYFAAMPDAVGLLKEFKAENDKLKQLLDRAMQGLEGYANYADNAEKICDERGYYSGDRLSLTEIPEVCPTLGMLRKSRQTLADIHKALGDTNGG